MLNINFKMLFFILLVSIAGSNIHAQKYVSEKGIISFYSDAPLEDITAKNTQSLAIIDLATSQVAFSIPITAFEFDKALMQEHFNEKYLESEKYPKATLQAQLIDFNTKATGLQNVKAKGKLTMHGITQTVEIPGTIEVIGNNKIVIASTFKIKLEDYKIKVPQLLFEKIAEVVDVKVDFTLNKK